MATLTGELISETYDALLKVTDNSVITGVKKRITDGFGNSTPLLLSSTDLEVDGNFILSASTNAASDTDKFLVLDTTTVKYRTGSQLRTDIGAGTVNSVGLSVPPAFSVANSPVTTSGTLAVSAAGNATQYIRGDGELATLPSGGGGGSSVNYYMNGSVAASVATYKQMANTAVIGTGTNFPLVGNGLIAQFLTDSGNPNKLLIPSGAWNFEMFFSVSSSGGSQKFYVELLKYNGATFTSIANSSVVPEAITGGTAIDLYLTSLAVPETVLLTTDRLAVRVYIVDSSGGRTTTLHTENSHLSLAITTFSGGISALNGLTANTQYFAVGSTGTDFNISSVTDTHTFNIPSASASNRGLITTGTQTIAGAKTLTGSLVGTSGSFASISAISADGIAGNISNNSTSFSALQVANLGSGNITQFSNSGGIVASIGNAGAITGTSIVKSGGTSSQFLKADGSVDTSAYLTSLSGAVLTTTNQSVAGVKTFTDIITAQPTTGTAIQAISTSSNAIQVTSTTGNGVDAGATTGQAIRGTSSGISGIGISGQSTGVGGIAGYFVGSSDAAYSLYATASGATTTAFYGMSNSASFATMRLTQSGAGNIALFDNTSGTVATITNAGGLTLAGALTGTSATFSGKITFSANSGATASGQIGRDATYGMFQWASSGTTNDWTVFGVGGAYIMHVPTGTVNTVFGGNTTSTAIANITSSDGGGKQLRFIGGVTTYNGLIANNENYANTIEITASSAVGTTTFNRNIAKFNLSDLSVTFSNLAGTGSRAVLADASGVLSAPVSDISVKENIKPIGYGLAEIVKMNPVWFDFIDGYKNYGRGRQNGNIAQEMKVIIPEAVFVTPSTGKMGINYDQLHAIYIKAIQELEARIKILEAN
jgi:hypothetical protein